MGREGLQSKEGKIYSKIYGLYEVMDMWSVGPIFTWTNKGQGLMDVKEKQYKVVGNKEWWTRFPKVSFVLQVA